MTEHVAPLPPAGWYPDPAELGQLRWWDGGQWSSHVAPAVRQERLGGAFAGLTTALLWMIGAQGVLYLGLALLYVTGLGSRSRTMSYAESPWTAFDTIDVTLSMGVGLLFFATIPVWCVWQHRLAAVAGAGRVRRSPGMHVGSWFIPVVSLWFPYQNVKDLWSAFVGKRVPGLLGGWWTLWLVSNFTSTGLLNASFSDELTAWEVNAFYLVDALLWLPMCAVAFTIVRRLARAARALEAQS